MVFGAWALAVVRTGTHSLTPATHHLPRSLLTLPSAQLPLPPLASDRLHNLILQDVPPPNLRPPNAPGPHDGRKGARISLQRTMSDPGPTKARKWDSTPPPKRKIRPPAVTEASRFEWDFPREPVLRPRVDVEEPSCVPPFPASPEGSMEGAASRVTATVVASPPQEPSPGKGGKYLGAGDSPMEGRRVGVGEGGGRRRGGRHALPDGAQGMVVFSGGGERGGGWMPFWKAEFAGCTNAAGEGVWASPAT